METQQAWSNSFKSSPQILAAFHEHEQIVQIKNSKKIHIGLENNGT